MSVEKDLVRATLNFEGMHEQVIRSNLLDFTSEVINQTPADTGRLRNNWQSTLNVPVTMNPVPTESVDPDPNGNDSKQMAQKASAALKVGDIFWFINNLPYAGFIENGTQYFAPFAMLRRNVQKLARRLK